MPSPKPVPHAVTEFIRLSDSVHHHVRRAHTVAQLLTSYSDRDLVTIIGPVVENAAWGIIEDLYSINALLDDHLKTLRTGWA